MSCGVWVDVIRLDAAGEIRPAAVCVRANARDAAAVGHEREPVAAAAAGVLVHGGGVRVQRADLGPG